MQGCANGWAAGELLAAYLANTVDAPASVYGAFRQEDVHTLDDLPVDHRVIVAFPARNAAGPTARVVLVSDGKIVQLIVPCTPASPQALASNVAAGQWTIRPD